MKIILIAMIIFLSALKLSAQTIDLTAGKPFPDFTLNHVTYYKKKQISLSDFKGQWMVLDFWNRYCAVCLEHMPKTDSLSKTFKHVNFFMIGYTGSMYTHKSDNLPIHKLYPELRQRFKLHLPMVYDSSLFHRLNVGACPYLVVIDPHGIVRAITTGLTPQNLSDILSGKAVSVEKAINRRGK